jgi:hypothetical protein
MIWWARSLRRSWLIWPPDMSPGSFPSWGGEVWQVTVSEAGPERERAAGREERLDAGWRKRMPGTRVLVVLMTGLVSISGAAAPAAGITDRRSGGMPPPDFRRSKT